MKFLDLRQCLRSLFVLSLGLILCNWVWANNSAPPPKRRVERAARPSFAGSFSVPQNDSEACVKQILLDIFKTEAQFAGLQVISISTPYFSSVFEFSAKDFEGQKFKGHLNARVAIERSINKGAVVCVCQGLFEEMTSDEMVFELRNKDKKVVLARPGFQKTYAWGY